MSRELQFDDSDRCPLLQNENFLENQNENGGRSSNKRPSKSDKWTAVIPNEEDSSDERHFQSRHEPTYMKSTWFSTTPHFKQFILLITIVSIILYMNFVLTSGSEENINVQHYPDVQSMKENSTDEINYIFKNSSSTESEIFDEENGNNSSVPLEALSENELRSLLNFTDPFFGIPSTETANIEVETNVYDYSTQIVSSSSSPLPPKDFDERKEGFLVWSEQCHIPDISPYAKDVMKHFEKQKYAPCLPKKPLTKIAFNESCQQYVLSVNQDLVKLYNKVDKISCCYETIDRSRIKSQADAKITYSKCIDFNKSTTLSSNIHSVLVRCYSNKKQTYINAHAMIPESESVRKRLEDWKQKDTNSSKPVSLLLIGIDSISRLNLIRAMPKTAKYLNDNKWFEMSGYNKMGDNTYPNLMALLTGLNQTTSYTKCEPTRLGGLEKCVFLWNLFRDHGFVTAYGEDESSINTFNYLKKGFINEPTDYYMRPFLMAAEKNLPVKLKSSLTFCLGYKHSAEHVYDYALEFAKRYKNDPYFALFWTNTFSHNGLSDCTSMDARMVEYLEQFNSIGTFNNTIVLFFSDHGVRFGPSRSTYSGHYEERLPFVFLWLPPNLKEEHPEFVQALKSNKNRLTNPYDMHMTLKHVLDLSGRVKNKSALEPSQGCPKCQSLLRPVPRNRSCDEIGITEHWCTCIPYESVEKNSSEVKAVAQGAIDYINDYLFNAHEKKKDLSKLCAKLKLHYVWQAYKMQSLTNTSSDSNTYRIIFYTKPNEGLFEATLVYNETTGNTSVTGEMSRLNSYYSDSKCTHEGAAKKYCSCLKSRG